MTTSEGNTDKYIVQMNGKKYSIESKNAKKEFVFIDINIEIIYSSYVNKINSNKIKFLKVFVIKIIKNC